MASVFWLLKVIIVSIFCRYSCALVDDLLYRVHISKSDDPEVKDFLRSVLKHQNDLNWARETNGDKQDIDDQILPLNGLPVKSKRSFYSGDMNYPNQKRSLYGYRRMEGDPSKLYTEEKNPMNDVYPYEGERNINSGRLYRELPQKRPIQEDDFLEDEEPGVAEAKFVSDIRDDVDAGVDYDHFDHGSQQVPQQIHKRSTDAERRLDEKLLLRSMLRNSGKFDINKDIKRKYNKFKRSLETNKDSYLENDMDFDESEIDVEPRSQKGVLFAPGHKYEFKTGDYKKRCIQDHDQHDIYEGIIPNNTVGNNEVPLSEFYYTGTHDVLGINQDLAMDNRENNTGCPKQLSDGKTKPQGENRAKRSTFKSKNSKSIKIKIFDDGKLIKNVKQGEGANSLILTIKDDKSPNRDASPIAAIQNDKSGINQDTNLVYTHAERSPAHSNPDKIDDTLLKIDKIISHDQDALRQNSLQFKQATLPVVFKVKKDNNYYYNPRVEASNYKTDLLNFDDLNGIQNVNKPILQRLPNLYNAYGKYHFIAEPENRDYLTGKLQSSTPLPHKIIKSVKSYERLDELGTPQDSKARHQDNIVQLSADLVHKPKPVVKQSKNVAANKKKAEFDEEVLRDSNVKQINSGKIYNEQISDEDRDITKKLVEDVPSEIVDTEGSYQYMAIPALPNSDEAVELVQPTSGETMRYRKQLSKRFKHNKIAKNNELAEVSIPKMQKVYSKKINSAASEITDGSRAFDDELPACNSRGQAKVNRLEDQTEPTSAAEQRELGKIGNNFKSKTPSMDMITTEKMIIIPFKKTTDTINSDDVGDDGGMDLDDENSIPVTVHKKGRFKVKDSKDMIHRDTAYVVKHSAKSPIDSSKNNAFNRLRADLQNMVIDDNKNVKFSNVRSTPGEHEDDDNEEVADNEDIPVKNKIENISIKSKIDESTDDSIDEDYEQNIDQKREAQSYDDELQEENYVNQDLTPNEVAFQARHLMNDDVVKTRIKLETPNENTLQSRHLMSIDQYDEVSLANSKPMNTDSGAKIREKRSLPDLFGMSDDEDYSEDMGDLGIPKQKRSEYEEGELMSSNKKKYETQTKGKVTNEHKPIHSQLVLKKNEPIILNKRSYLQSASDKENRKEKKEIHSDSTHLVAQQKLNIFSNKMDTIQKRDDTNYKVTKVRSIKRAHSNVNTLPLRQAFKNPSQDTTAASLATYGEASEQNMPDENSDQNLDQANGGLEPAESAGEEQEEQQDSGSNAIKNGEMDILSKTQTILMRVTGIPVGGENNEESLPNTGETDDDDDSDLRGIQSVSNGANNMKKNVKYHESSESNANVKNDEILDDILKLVASYKKNKARQLITRNNLNGINNNKKFDNNVLGDDDNNFAHHLHKEKKLHPITNTLDCKMKQNNNEHLVIEPVVKMYHPKHVEQEQVEVGSPQMVQEGFANDETVADKRTKTAVLGKENDENPADDLIEVELYPNVKRVSRDDVGNKNPLQFTPDSIDSFKNIVEGSNGLIDSDDDMYRYKRYLKNIFCKTQRSETKKPAPKKTKREIVPDEDDALYNSFMNPVNNAEDVDDNVRLRRYKSNKPGPYSYYPHVAVPEIRQALTSANEAQPAINKPAAPIDIKNPGAAATGPALAVTIRQSGNVSSQTTTRSVESDACPAHGGAEDETCSDDDDPKGKHTPKHKGGGNGKNNDGDVTYDVRIHSKNEEVLQHEKNMKGWADKTKDKNKKARDQLKEHEHMKTVLSGHLALNIIETLHNRLKCNEKLYARFGTAIARKCAQQQVTEIDKFRELQSKKDIKHAQLMLHQVIVMLNKIVADQVHRRTCLVLPPNLQDFLQNSMRVSSHGLAKTLQVSEGFPLPQIKGQPSSDTVPHGDEKQGDFLFHTDEKNSNINNEAPKDDTIKKKIILIKKLLNKYNHMSEKCQIKVEPVKAYLEEHLKLLMKADKVQKMGKGDMCTISPAFAKCENGTGGNGTAKHDVGRNIVTTLDATAVTNGEHASESPKRFPLGGNPFERSIDDNGYGDINSRNYYNEVPKFKGKLNHLDEQGDLSFDKSSGYSDKYRKLVDAADSYRRKREIEERLGRLFGRSHKTNINKSNKISKEGSDIRRVAFEQPIVYSVD